MKPIRLDGFEQKFQDSVDPWNYRTSPFEARKRQVLLRACGPAKVGRTLELACAIGEMSRALTSRSLRLTASDGAPTALAEARRLTPEHMRIDYRFGILPRDVPPGPFDLIVLSEIAYYLTSRDLDRLLRSLVRALAPGGRIVALHHLVPFDDAAQVPALAQERLRRTLSRFLSLVHARNHGRFEVVTFRRGRETRNR